MITTEYVQGAVPWLMIVGMIVGFLLMILGTGLDSTFIVLVAMAVVVGSLVSGVVTGMNTYDSYISDMAKLGYTQIESISDTNNQLFYAEKDGNAGKYALISLGDNVYRIDLITE